MIYFFYMKGLFLSLALVLTLVPGVALAHESKQSGDTIVFLHVNPNDEPVVGESASFYMLITKNRYQFPIEECLCSVSVLDSKGEVLVKKEFTGELGSARVPYIFSKAGIYTIKIEGTPNVTGAFEPFSLSFEKRVEPGSVLNLLKDKKFLFSAIGVLFLLAFAGVYTRKYIKKRLN